jgi:hypothetical protein
MSKFDQPSSYTGIIPWPVFLGLQNKWMQGMFENDFDWVKRIALKMTSTPNQQAVSNMMPLSSQSFKDELQAKVASKNWGATAVKQDQLMNGMSRVAERTVYSGGDKNTPAKQVTLPHGQNALGVFGKDAAKRSANIVEMMVNATSVDTPENGSIFWNGIDQRALVQYVNKWNKETSGMFGQLEATTDVRLVDNQFLWDNSATGKNLQKYFAGVSENLGKRAKGHMTAAVLWGFRNTSILTYAELPRILYNMVEALERGEAPAVTDVSIVVIDDIKAPGTVSIVNNSAVLDLPIWKPKDGQRGYSREECELTGVKLRDFSNTVGDWVGMPTVPKSEALIKYLQSRPNIPSPAALRIKQDAKSLVRSSNAF